MFLLKGIIIGLIIGTPVGAVGALCMSRTLQYGVRSGLVTGLGCSVADCIYASVGAFGLTAISAFLAENDTVISISGGVIVTGMGVAALLKKGNVIAAMKKKPGYIKMFLSSFCIGITNPAVVIISMVAFGYFKIPKERTIFESAMLSLGFFLGTMVWWFILIGIIKLIKNKYGNNIGNKANKFFGIIMIILGLIVFGRLFFEK